MKYYAVAKHRRKVALILGVEYELAEEFAELYQAKGWEIRQYGTKNKAIQGSRTTWLESRLEKGGDKREIYR